MLGFIVGAVVGLLLGYLLAALLTANDVQLHEDAERRKAIRNVAVRDYAIRLKARIKIPEHPWQDVYVEASDIDEVLEEMVGEY